MSYEREHTVTVWGQPQMVTVYQKSKSVWVATGSYMGESHSTQDRTEGAAVKRWREWARHKGG